MPADAFVSPPPIPRALIGRRIFSFHTDEGVRAFWKRSHNESTYTNTRWHTKELMFTRCEYAGGR